MKNPTITRTPHWTAEDVRITCIRNDLYTCGTCEEYDAMLTKVSTVETPSDFFIWQIAEDITEHSDYQTVTNVMYILANEAVRYTFDLDE